MAGDDCLSYIPQLVTRSESLTRSFSSLLLGDVLSRLCGWSCFRPPTMPGQGSPLVSASGQVFVYRSPSPFRVPTAPCSPFSTNAVSFFLGEVIAAAQAARPPVGSLRARLVPQRVRLCRIPPSLVGCLFPCSATWASSSVFYFYFLSDIHHEFDGLLSLGHFVAAGSRIG